MKIVNEILRLLEIMEVIVVIKTVNGTLIDKE